MLDKTIESKGNLIIDWNFTLLNADRRKVEEFFGSLKHHISIEYKKAEVIYEKFGERFDVLINEFLANCNIKVNTVLDLGSSQSEQVVAERDGSFDTKSTSGVTSSSTDRRSCTQPIKVETEYNFEDTGRSSPVLETEDRSNTSVKESGIQRKLRKSSRGYLNNDLETEFSTLKHRKRSNFCPVEPGIEDPLKAGDSWQQKVADDPEAGDCLQQRVSGDLVTSGSCRLETTHGAEAAILPEIKASARSVVNGPLQQGCSSPTEKRNKCDICNKQFVRVAWLKNHLKTHEEMHSCKICFISFENADQLVEHQKAVHPKTKKFTCEECNKRFTSERSLRRHKELHASSSSTFTCEVCEQSFKRKTHLKLHMQKDHRDAKEKILVCTICKESFSRLSEFKLHKAERHDEKSYTCTICDMAFGSLLELRKHRICHKGTKEFSCNICGKKFANSGNFKAHKRSHTGEKPYLCNICGKSFGQIGTLKAHRVTHSNERPYMCSVCGKSFNHISNLNHHRWTHEEKKLFDCDVCGKSFRHASQVQRHKVSHSDVRKHICDLCGAQFTRMESLKSHNMAHRGIKPYKCPVCSRCFTQYSTLMRHKLTHGLKQHECQLCGQTFMNRKSFDEHKTQHGDYSASVRLSLIGK